MKIALLSDAHDHADHFSKALDLADTLGAEVILFAGDLNAPFMMKFLADRQQPFHAVFGNNEGDRFRIAKAVADMPQVTLHGEYAALELGSKRVGMTHYPFYANAMAKSGDYDLVVFGHDHTPRIEAYGACLAVNPGSLYGAPVQASMAIYDTDAHAAQLYALDGSFLAV